RIESPPNSCTNSCAPEPARRTASRPLQLPSTMYSPQDEYWRFDPSPSAVFLKSTAVWPDWASIMTICPDVLLTARCRWSGEKAASEGCAKGCERTAFDFSATFQTNTYRPSVASSCPSREKATVLLVPIFHGFIAAPLRRVP